jgi:hypothetical protein
MVLATMLREAAHCRTAVALIRETVYGGVNGLN